MSTVVHGSTASPTPPPPPPPTNRSNGGGGGGGNDGKDGFLFLSKEACSLPAVVGLSPTPGLADLHMDLGVRFLHLVI